MTRYRMLATASVWAASRRRWELSIPTTQHPALLRVRIKLKTDASGILSEVVHTPSHPRNEAPAVLSLDPK
jgi:hypothetical protein